MLKPYNPTMKTLAAAVVIRETELGRLIDTAVTTDHAGVRTAQVWVAKSQSRVSAKGDIDVEERLLPALENRIAAAHPKWGAVGIRIEGEGR